MSTKLIEEENTVFEIDEDCLKEKEKQADREKTVELDDLCHMQMCRHEKRQTAGCMNSSIWMIVLLLCLCRKG